MLIKSAIQIYSKVQVQFINICAVYKVLTAHKWLIAKIYGHHDQIRRRGTAAPWPARSPRHHLLQGIFPCYTTHPIESSVKLSFLKLNADLLNLVQWKFNCAKVYTAHKSNAVPVDSSLLVMAKGKDPDLCIGTPLPRSSMHKCFFLENVHIFKYRKSEIFISSTPYI